MTLQLHTLDDDLTFVIPHFLSSEECDQYIALSEELGYEQAYREARKTCVPTSGVERDNRRAYSGGEAERWRWVHHMIFGRNENQSFGL